MEKVVFKIPSLWADHHTLAVREVLGRVDGIEAVTASALYKDVVIEYDPAALSPDALAVALADAGYSVDQVPEMPSYPERIDDSSDWFQFQERITETDMRDLEMSGEHRKY